MEEHRILADVARDHEGTGFHNHPLLPVIIAFLCLTYITVALRIWTRTRYVKFLGWDDYMILIALLFFSVYCGSTIAMFVISKGAAGIAAISYRNVQIAVKLLIVSECFYILTMIAFKLSLAIFFLRILITQWQRYLIIGAVTTSTIFGVAYLFFAVFQCGWYTNVDVLILRMVAGKCAPKSVGLGMNYTYATLGTISDWTCGLIPILILRGSNMPRKTKIIVCGLLAFAAIGSVASIVRMVYLDSITVPTGDFFRNISKLAVWSTIEPGIGITVASLATLRRLFQKIFSSTKLFSTQRARSNSLAPTIMTQERVGGPRLESDATAVADEAGLEMDREKSMGDEMRAYGMVDFEECSKYEEGDLDDMVPRGLRKKPSLYFNQRVAVGKRAGRVRSQEHAQRRQDDGEAEGQFSLVEEGEDVREERGNWTC